MLAGLADAGVAELVVVFAGAVVLAIGFVDAGVEGLAVVFAGCVDAAEVGDVAGELNSDL